MAYTATDLTVIEAAIANGQLRVKFADREVTFRSMDELIRARDIITASIDGTSSIRTTKAKFNKD